MDQLEQTQRAENLLERLKKVIQTSILSYEIDDFASYENIIHLKVKVPFNDLKTAKQQIWDAREEDNHELYCVIRLEAAEPKLAPANLGDFVLPWSDWDDCEEDLAVGIVTAIYKETDGTVRYGCRHIIERSEHRQVYSGVFEVTDDKYGGHPEGFYKIISRDEAISRASASIRKTYEKRLADIHSCLSTLEKDIGDRVSLLTHVVQTTELRAEGLR
jgi:hypothetical protein